VAFLNGNQLINFDRAMCLTGMTASCCISILRNDFTLDSVKGCQFRWTKSKAISKWVKNCNL